MFPKWDFLFNVGLVVCFAYIGLVLSVALFRFAILLIGG
jgi:hypothetical protein